MKLRPELLSLLRSVVREQRPDLLPAVDRLDRGLLLSPEDKGSLIRRILSEIADTGFISETDGSIERGLMLEEIGDFLGDMQGEPTDI